MKYLLLMAMALMQAVLGVILWYKRHDRISRTFTYFTSALLVWTFVNITLDYLTHMTYDQSIADGRLGIVNILNTVGFFFANIILLLLYESVTAALGVRNAKDIKTVRIVGLSFALVSLLPVFSGSFSITSAKFTYHYGPAALLLVPYFAILCWKTIRLGIKKLKSKLTPRERQQVMMVLTGLLASAAWGIVFIILIPSFTKNDDLLFIGYMAPYIFTLLMYYGIIRLGFLNFRQIIARSIGYMFSLLGLGLIFVIIVNVVIRFVLHDKLSIAEVIIFTIFSFMMAIGFQPAKRYFDKLTNEIFYRDAYDPQLLYDRLNRLLVSSLDIKYVLDYSAEIIAGSLRSEYCQINLFDEDNTIRSFGSEKVHIPFEVFDFFRSFAPKSRKQAFMVDNLDKHQTEKLKNLMLERNIAALIPLWQRGGKTSDTIGYIVLGSKRSGSPYSEYDMNTLETIANELILAIQNTMHFEEIQQFNLTLQERVEDATRKLRVTNEKLKKLDETKDEFISMASHQMRTPLTSVKGYLSMVLDGDVGKLNKQQEELLKQSFLSSQRMVNLISDLLNLSRLNTGKFVIDATSVDLRDVVEQELMQLREVAKSRDIALDYTRPESFPVLQIDENKMHQVVMNFIDNAVYYTPNGGTVSVSLVETPTTIEYRVKDTGIGVPREVQRHLFTKFYRAENAKRARPDGTGLGLFMAKKVIVAQGGAVIFESEEGKGSTFGFRFSKAVLASEQGVEAAAAAKLGTKK
ncbi:hypothetical protein KDA06_00520 [Candidatus Saccharibacteria bacterium]|nr:hypothetical protein [Candidatus Saccharibacteria bacterium]